MQEKEELIVLRDKASTETLLDYVDYITPKNNSLVER